MNILKVTQGMTGAEAAERLYQNDLQVAEAATKDKIVFKTGTNLFNSMGGSIGTVLNPQGQPVAAQDWYTTPPIPWGGNTEMAITSRSWAQYDAAGNVTSNWYNSTATSIAQTLTKDPDAVEVRTSVGMTSKDTSRANYGPTLLPFERFYYLSAELNGAPLYGLPEPKEYLKEMFFSESFQPQGATYTDGLVNSPINVIWVDGATGVINLTRNADGLVTAATATHVKGGITRTLTVGITRDSEGNTTTVTTFVNQ